MQAKAKQTRPTQEDTVVEEEFLVGSDAVMNKLGNPDITDLTFVEVEGGLYIDSGESTVYAEVEGGETVAEEVEAIPDGGTEITISSPEEKVNSSTDTDATLAGD
jgi:hypothetical protein